MIEYTIDLFWDDEASVWIAESRELPGLILESASFDTLVENVKEAVPELLELDGKDHSQIKLHFKAERLAVVA
jgi:predicted RNase H-like HicB family nuclease